MLYKLYLQTFKEGQQPDYSIISDMVRIYQENGVTILGHFVNKSQPNQTVLITIYRDEEHYRRFVDKIKEDPKYQKRRELLAEVREDIMVIDLELNKHSLLHPSEIDLTSYIDDVRSLTQSFSTTQ